MLAMSIVVELNDNDNDTKNPNRDFENHTQTTTYSITDAPSHTLIPSPTPDSNLRMISSTTIITKNTETTSLSKIEDTITNCRRLSQTSQLRLSHYKLTTFPISVFNLWPTVQILDLTHNSITVLPNEISQLIHLRQLLLNDNKLENIPNVIGQLTGLTSLDLECNLIESLPNEIGTLTQMKELNIRNNRLRSLPESLGLLRQLEWLVLELNENLESDQIPPEVWLNMGVHILFKNDAADKIVSGIFLGSDKTADNLSLLKQLKITHILTLNDKQPSFLKEFKYKMAPILDNSEQILTHDYLADCIEFIEQGRKKGAVLVHCTQGISRSSTIVIAYIMTKQSLSFDQAILFVRKHRPCVFPNMNFRHQLLDLQFQLEKQLKDIYSISIWGENMN